MRKNVFKNFFKKETIDDDVNNHYFDYIQTGPMEEETLQEFEFDKEKFHEYLESKEMDKLSNQDKYGR